MILIMMRIAIIIINRDHDNHDHDDKWSIDMDTNEMRANVAGDHHDPHEEFEHHDEHDYDHDEATPARL